MKKINPAMHVYFLTTNVTEINRWLGTSLISDLKRSHKFRAVVENVLRYALYIKSYINALASGAKEIDKSVIWKLHHKEKAIYNPHLDVRFKDNERLCVHGYKCCVWQELMYSGNYNLGFQIKDISFFWKISRTTEKIYILTLNGLKKCPS